MQSIRTHPSATHHAHRRHARLIATHQIKFQPPRRRSTLRPTCHSHLIAILLHFQRKSLIAGPQHIPVFIKQFRLHHNILATTTNHSLCHTYPNLTRRFTHSLRLPIQQLIQIFTITARLLKIRLILKTIIKPLQFSQKLIQPHKLKFLILHHFLFHNFFLIHRQPRTNRIKALILFHLTIKSPSKIILLTFQSQITRFIPFLRFLIQITTQHQMMLLINPRMLPRQIICHFLRLRALQIKTRNRTIRKTRHHRHQIPRQNLLRNLRFRKIPLHRFRPKNPIRTFNARQLIRLSHQSRLQSRKIHNRLIKQIHISHLLHITRKTLKRHISRIINRQIPRRPRFNLLRKRIIRRLIMPNQTRNLPHHIRSHRQFNRPFTIRHHQPPRLRQHLPRNLRQIIRIQTIKHIRFISLISRPIIIIILSIQNPITIRKILQSNSLIRLTMQNNLTRIHSIITQPQILFRTKITLI